MKPNFPAEITNMVMVYDKQRDMVVVEDRKNTGRAMRFLADMRKPVKVWQNPQSVRSTKKPACG